jgi:aminoglycoside phosphotransferase (APT) family kinase protein
MMLDAPTEIRADERFDEAAVERFLLEARPELRGPIRVEQFRGGHANLTYALHFGTTELVLRRPPLGPVAPKAHDMAREFRALRALAPLYPLAPRPLVLCEDTALIGAVFFVMERRRGIVVRNQWPAELGDDPALRRRIGESLVDALADLHCVDVTRPEIAALGKAEGFAERQVKGWTERWQRAKTRDIPAMDELGAFLLERIPKPSRAAVVHNDWKLDNAMLDPGDPGKLVAVFDWDMTTLGEPLVDLGTFLGYWAEADDPVPRGTGSTVTALPGFPGRADLAARYASRTGIDIAPLPFYETFGLFKTAVVLEQIYVRFVRGQTQDERFELLGSYVPMLADAARRLAAQLEG